MSKRFMSTRFNDHRIANDRFADDRFRDGRRSQIHGADARFEGNMALSDSAAHLERGGSHRDLPDLIRHAAHFGGRHGYRVAAPGASGHIFFDAGRVIHAEFGEDCGLRAVNEMLRTGAVALEPVRGSWPAQATLHLSPELLLSLTERDTSRVVRKVDLPIEPPPLPPTFGAEASELVPPVHPSVARTGGSKRSVSGVVPKFGALGSSPAPASGAQLVAKTGQVAGSEPAPARAPSRTPAAASALRARESRSPSRVAVRAPDPPVAVNMAVPAPPSIAPVPPRASDQPTTMVRITPHGELLAARGKNAEQVAEAAAFIHGLAMAIAADFGRRARANVHLSGGGMSLLVARSEVNDIAAALGATERVSSLLSKVGLK